MSDDAGPKRLTPIFEQAAAPPQANRPPEPTKAAEVPNLTPEKATTPEKLTPSRHLTPEGEITKKVNSDISHENKVRASTEKLLQSWRDKKEQAPQRESALDRSKGQAKDGWDQAR